MSSVPNAPDRRQEALSPRQQEVCDLIVEGLTSKAIAERLGTTVHTVKAHRAEVMRRMGVDSVAELVRVCLAERDTNARVNVLPPAQAPQIEGPIRVLVVEDQPLFRDMLTSSLAAFGHVVRSLENGRELERVFDEFQPHIILLDVNLNADENGLDLAVRIRRRSRCGVVFMSSNGRVEDRVAALERGADAYFVKPISFVELNMALRNLVQRLH
ncbi:response regulator [Aquabacterium lacunae]|uniref:Response regulator n=1 Tax=Aquabacterium lacunae TaxID=2528630 RepID=A0A4Q9H4P7_9BURK|nr:response regulator [Aquabacterium lacunae]TBO33885.1 response regulator [Aquabacterium lacunae]